VRDLLAAGEPRIEVPKGAAMYFAGEGCAKTTRRKTGREGSAKRARQAAKKAKRKAASKRTAGKRKTSRKKAA